MQPKQNSNLKFNDMTAGSPTRLILTFALPLLVGNIFQQLYNLVDSVVVGNYVGKTALAGVGTSFPIIFMFTALFMGVGMGATIMVAQYYGAGDHERVKKTISTIYTAVMVGAIPLTLLGVFLCGPLLKLMLVPADTYREAYTYILIIFIGITAMLGYNVNAGILQGVGDSKSPLLFLVIACGINIVLDLLFVLVFGWGVAGVAIATIIAQFFSWVFGIFFINKKYPDLEINPFKFRFDRHLFWQAIRLGIPAGVQQAIFSLGIMVMQSLVNSYGSDFMAGFNGSNKIDTFAFMPIQSFATAVTTFVGQNIGAGKYDRVKRGASVTLMMSIICSIVIGVLLLFIGPFLMRLFSPDAAVIEAGMAYLYRILPFYAVLSLLFIINGVMRGAGEMIVPVISTMVSLWAARVPSAYLLAHFFGRDNMFFSYVIGWVLGAIIAIAYYLSGRWKNKSIVKKASINTEVNTAD